MRIRLNSAQFKLKLPVGAELGNIRSNSVCDDVITNVEARHAKLDKKGISNKVELDLNHMIEIKEKLLKGVIIDSHVVSNLVL